MSPPTHRVKSEIRLAPEEGPGFQIAPMIDIILVLLIFFMSISSTEVLQPAGRSRTTGTAGPRNSHC